MEILKSLIVVAMGFLMGLVLAGAGGLSAEAFLSRLKSNENTKKIEVFWQETGLSYSDVEALISNIKCHSSKLYERACLNAISQYPGEKDFELILSEGSTKVLSASVLENFNSEKETLSYFTQNHLNIDFDKTLRVIFNQASDDIKAQLASSLINGFLSVYYDPHTYILPVNYYEQVSSKIDRSPYFVGFSYMRKNGEFIVDHISINSDADRGGLRADDKILSINGQAVKNATYTQFSQMLKDQNVRKFIFQVERDHRIVEISFDRSFRLMSQVQFNVIGAQKEFSLITLSKFSRGVCNEVRDYLGSKSFQSIKGVVLDLRNNPGGQLDEAACLAGLFLGPDKKAYYIEYTSPSQPNEVVLTSDPQAYKGPLAVLVNNRSASASETLAGALQEYKRATLIGRRTFGKGTFQEPEEWLMNPKISLFKTQGYYLLPSRHSTQLVGVTPDIQMQAPKETERREENLFSNPFKPLVVQYPGLKSHELFETPIAKDCLNSAKPGADSETLKTALSLLSCEVASKSQMASTGEARALE